MAGGSRGSMDTIRATGASTAARSQGASTGATCPARWRAYSFRVVAATPTGRREVRLARYINSINMGLVRVRPGHVLMGESDEPDRSSVAARPAHLVHLAKPFYLSAREVTQGQYRTVMGTEPSAFDGHSRPVESVTWRDAVEFCARMSRREGLRYRLPTEREWEYACRAGSQGTHYWGTDGAADCAWFAENSQGQTHDTGRKAPNAFGLYDMSGNVWEWCQSLPWGYPYKPDDGREDLAVAGRRVLRGGSFNTPRKRTRSACRKAAEATDAWANVGFRVLVEEP